MKVKRGEERTLRVQRGEEGPGQEFIQARLVRPSSAGVRIGEVGASEKREKMCFVMSHRPLG